MREMIRLQGSETKNAQSRERVQKLRGRGSLGKKFSDLTPAEKDELLKRLAVTAGLVEE